MGAPAAETVVEELRAGLRRRPLPEIPCKYFYDEVGSALFEEITRLPEYYQTRTEEAILEAQADRIVADAGSHSFAELGSGAGRKIRLLLDAAERRGPVRRVQQLDINPIVVSDSVRALSRDYPDVEFQGVVGDFETDLARLGPGGDRTILFFAGTVGNLHPDRVPRFLRSVAAQMAPEDSFLVGIDLVKDPTRLHAAYNDAAGVTAAFNRNILAVVNRRFDADFDPDAFEHVAFYDREREWIEMRLEARRPLTVRVRGADVVLDLPKGGQIRTELSCKYGPESWRRRAAGTGLGMAGWYTDPERLFALARMRHGPDTLPA